MKKIYYFILSALLLCSSCSWLDINDDPNTATSVQPDYLYNYAMTSVAANRCSGDLYYPLGWMGQTIATGGNGGWGDINVYDISPYSLGNTWKAFYAVGGANLKQAIALAEEAVQPNVSAQCKIAFAQLVYSATTLYGDIPYSEGWNIEKFIYPKFDAQKDILDNLIILLDEAIGQVDLSDSYAISDYDLAYKGDMDKWIRYANSLKFRIAILMVDKDPSKAALIAELLKEDKMINSLKGNFEFPFEAKLDKENPKYRMMRKYTEGENLEFFANKTVLDPLKVANDPRLDRYFDMGKDTTEFIAVGTNDEGKYGKHAMISAYLYRAVAPEVFFSYQEQLFLEAEVYARGLGVAVDINKANDKYKSGLTAAMQWLEVKPEAIAKFMSDDFKALTAVADPVKEIHMQQWLDLMDRPLEAFTQWRRSGKKGQETPTLTVPVNAVPSQLVYRWTYSPDEATANKNTPQGFTMLDQVWFDE